MISGSQAGRVFWLRGDAATVGRDGTNDVVLDSPSVSRVHARIARRGEEYVVEDAGSRNGVALNGRRIAAATPHQIEHRDVLEFAGHRVLFLRCGSRRDLRELATIHLDREQVGAEAEEPAARVSERPRLSSGADLALRRLGRIRPGLQAIRHLTQHRRDTQLVAQAIQRALPALLPLLRQKRPRRAAQPVPVGDPAQHLAQIVGGP